MGTQWPGWGLMEASLEIWKENQERGDLAAGKSAARRRKGSGSV